MSLIGRGHDAEAIEVIRRDNPFPWVCGLVCTRPCELMCVRGRVDKPISIKFLKAFAAERALSDRHYHNPPKEPEKGKRIAVVGAGPGGMTAAYYLSLKGYAVTVFEALPVAGGMMMLGIPRYRLPREVIDREVAMLEDLGVEFRFNTRYGRDITLEGLKADGFDAVFLAIGAHESFKLNIPGESDFPQVIEAIDLLRRVALGDRRMPGKHAVIVGVHFASGADEASQSPWAASSTAIRRRSTRPLATVATAAVIHAVCTSGSAASSRATPR